MKNEFYNLGQPSKNLLERDKRLQAAKAEYLNQYDQNLKEATELKEAANLESAMSSARFSYASTYARSKNRVNKLNEEIQYNENASLIGMTEMVAQVVESALLLDEEEYSALNPEYKESMRETIFSLLKEADIEEVITNKDTLAIMEHVARFTPSAREGINLTEDELANYIAANKPVDIDGSIRNLSRNVSGKVAQLMEKEQAKVDKINSEVKKAKAPKDKKEKEDKLTVEDILSQLESGELVEEDIDNMLADGVISQEVYDEVVETVTGGQEEVVEEEIPMEEEQPEEEIPMEEEVVEEAPVEEQPVEMGASPKKQIQLSPDGTISVNIFENRLIRETPRCGLIESLAVNEAQNMLARGEEYNPDLALANAIMYVTITETMNEMGLLDVNDQAYSHIISAAGGNLLEKKEIDKIGRLEYAQERANDKKRKADATFNKTTSNLKKKYNNYGASLAKSKKNNYKYNEGLAKAEDKHSKQYAKIDAKLKKTENKLFPKYIAESAVTQWGVQQNTSNPDDFAERIRQKKLLKENNQTLHD